MRMKCLITFLCICFILTGCEKTDKNSLANKDISHLNKINQESQEYVENDKDITENVSAENYNGYTGIWTEDGKNHDLIISNGGTEFSVNITNEIELNGYLFSQQGTSDRIAEIYNITGIINNKECYYEFTDDGWGGTGTLYIQFLDDAISIEVKDYKTNKNNLSGFGISGKYKLKRSDKVVEKEESESEMSEEDLMNDMYARYYAHWSEAEMLVAIDEKSQYLEKCTFYKEVLEYMENVREIKDIANVVEPLFYSDMIYYEKQDFDNVPLLIIHLAKNEIYARKGYIFKDEDLNNYFMGQLWYEPSTTSDDFSTNVFNDYENANLKLLSDLDTYK